MFLEQHFKRADYYLFYRKLILKYFYQVNAQFPSCVIMFEPKWFLWINIFHLSNSKLTVILQYDSKVDLKFSNIMKWIILGVSPILLLELTLSEIQLFKNDDELRKFHESKVFFIFIYIFCHVNRFKYLFYLIFYSLYNLGVMYRKGT